MLLRRIKTLLLFLLAGFSLILSYLIWHGSWLGHTEVGFSTTSGPSTDSVTPPLQQVTRPYQVVLTTGKPTAYSVALPETAFYKEWLTMLNTTSVSDLRLRSNFTPTSMRRMAEFDFGVTLNRSSVSQFVPSVGSTAFTPATAQIILFQQETSNKIQIALQAGPQTYIGTTDIPPEQFTQTISNEVKLQPWLLVQNNPESLIPKQSLHLKKYSVKLTQPTLLPLVHSFFVNTQALTRIQENKGKVIWTDGSRAVQWDTGTRQLTFEDPNASSGESGQQNSVSAVLNYLGSHGGIPKNAMVYVDQSSYQNNFIFRSVIDGFPLLNTTQQYRIFLANGHIVTYQRPLVTFSIPKHSSTVKTISSKQLNKSLSRLHLSLQEVQPILGYDLETKAHHTGVLLPVYKVYRQDSLVATINAVTGSVIKGGASS